MMCGEPERTTSVYELCLAIGIFTLNGSWVWRTKDVTIWAHNNCTVRKGCWEKQKYTFMKVKISNFPSRALAWLIHSGYNAASNCGMFLWKRHHWQGCGLFQDMGHGPHSTTLVCIFVVQMLLFLLFGCYYLCCSVVICVVLCIVCV
jgi:hypothetical protein